MHFISALPLYIVCDLREKHGVGDKKLLREVGRLLGLQACTVLAKRAIQFGSRIAKVKRAKEEVHFFWLFNYFLRWFRQILWGLTRWTRWKATIPDTRTAIKTLVLFDLYGVCIFSLLSVSLKTIFCFKRRESLMTRSDPVG